MANPDFVDFGTEQDSTGAITVNAPAAWNANDILILYVATDGFTPSLSTANGFVLAQDPAGNTASVNFALGVCGIHLFWKRAIGNQSGGLDPMPVIAAPSGGGTVQACHTNSYRNCRTTGTPFHKIVTATASSSSSITSPSVTTTLANCTIFGAVASENNDTKFDSWGFSGSASPGGTIDSGWASGLGNACAWVGGRGGYAAAGTHNGTSTFATATRQAQIGYALASLDEPPSGQGAITLADMTSSAAGTIIVVGAGASTLADDTAAGTAGVASLTGTGAVTLADDTSSAAGSIAVVGAASPTLGSDTGAGAGTITGAFAVDNATVKQRVNGAPPENGTLTTDAITTASDTAIFVTIMRGIWANAPSAPTDNKGNTYTLLSGVHFYNDFPASAAAVYVNLSGTRGSGHTFSMAFGDAFGVGSGAGDEATISVVSMLGVGFIGTHTYVERATATSVSGLATSTNAAGGFLQLCLGNGITGFTHAFQPSAGTIIAAATATADNASGTIQITAAVEAVSSATTRTVTWTNPAHQEGGQLYSFPLQLTDDLTGTANVTLGADTVAGAGVIAAQGTGSPALADDTTSAVGVIAASGLGAPTLLDDSTTAAGSIALQGAAASALADDTLAATAGAGLSGAGATSMLDDVTAAAGDILLQGTGSATAADDTAVGTGSAGAPGSLQGSGGATLDDVTAAGLGVISVTGAAAVTLVDDAASGAAIAAVQGAGSPALLGDTAAGAGFGGELAGAGAATLADDTLIGHGVGPDDTTPSTLPASIRILSTEIAVKLHNATFRQNSIHRPLTAEAFTEAARIDFAAEFPGGVTFRMTNGTKTVEGAAAGGSDGELTYQWATGDLDTPGSYEAVFIATDGAGRLEEFPTETNLQIAVVASL